MSSAPRPPRIPVSPGRTSSSDRVVWVEATSSTQDEARELLRAGRPAPFAVATTQQRAGRGRLGRTWVMPRGAGLALTLVHRPDCPPERRHWYPLVVALAVREAVLTLCGVEVVAKWPNDLLAMDGNDARGIGAGGRKLAGILVEVAPGGELLVGIGVNLRGPIRDEHGAPFPAAVALDELVGTGGRAPGRATPTDTDTDMGAEATTGIAVPATPPGPDALGADTFARVLAETLVREVDAEFARLDAAHGDGVGSGQADRYRESCITINQAVRIEPLGSAASASGNPSTAGTPTHGTALGIDDRGRLLVRTEDGTRPIDVGDVHHVRPQAVGPDRVGADGAADSEERSGERTDEHGRDGHRARERHEHGGEREEGSA